MIILNALLALLCAVVILALVLQIGILANLFIIQSNPDNHSLGQLLSYPAGVDSLAQAPDGHDLKTIHRGSGPPVLLVHEAGLDSRTFQLIWDILCAYGYQLITYDLRGHGQDKAVETGNIHTHLDDLEAVIRSFEVKKALIVGHGFGAYLALRLLQSKPYLAETHIRGIVSLAGYAGELPRKGLSLPWMYRWLGRSSMATLMRSKLYGTGLAASAFGDTVSQSMIRAYLEIILERPVGRLQQLFQTLTSESFLSELDKRFPVPVLLLYSRGDQRVHPGHSVQIARRLPKAKLSPIEGPVGHLLPWEAPHQVVDQIRESFPELRSSAQTA